MPSIILAVKGWMAPDDLSVPGLAGGEFDFYGVFLSRSELMGWMNTFQGGLWELEEAELVGEARQMAGGWAQVNVPSVDAIPRTVSPLAACLVDSVARYRGLREIRAPKLTLTLPWHVRTPPGESRVLESSLGEGWFAGHRERVATWRVNVYDGSSSSGPSWAEMSRRIRRHPGFPTIEMGQERSWNGVFDGTDGREWRNVEYEMSFPTSAREGAGWALAVFTWAFLASVEVVSNVVVEIEEAVNS